MAKKKAARVQRFGARNCWAKKVGQHLGADGQPRPKVWYFQGCSEEEAIGRALAIKADWRRLRGEGVSVWPSDYVPPHKQTRPILADSGAAAPQPAEREVEIGALTLSDCLKLYRAELEREVGVGKLAASRPKNAERAVNQSLAFLNKDSRISDINRGRLVDLSAHLRSRPKTKTGEPMSLATVRTYMAETATFLRYCDRHEDIPWSKPRNFDELWEVGDLKPKSEGERKERYMSRSGKGVELVSIDALKKLYRAADATERAWILLALNCAFQAIDLSDLRAYEVHGDKIIRDREKTGVEGRWSLWPETVRAIEAARVGDNEGERLFLTPKGNPLVGRAARTDYVAQRPTALPLRGCRARARTTSGWSGTSPGMAIPRPLSSGRQRRMRV